MVINPQFIEISRKLRKDQTPWEKILWSRIKNRLFLNLKFRRQTVIGPYIYDFTCFEKKLIIELDGSQHKIEENTIKDLEKQYYAEKLGYKVVRFDNSDVDSNL